MSSVISSDMRADAGTRSHNDKTLSTAVSLLRSVRRYDLPIPVSIKRSLTMNGTKLGFFGLIFLFGAVILVPVVLAGIASADCGICSNDCDRYYRCAYDGNDLLRCDSSPVSDYDYSAVRDYDRNAVRHCDNCAGEYRCDLYGCAWVH